MYNILISSMIFITFIIIINILYSKEIMITMTRKTETIIFFLGKYDIVFQFKKIIKMKLNFKNQ